MKKLQLGMQVLAVILYIVPAVAMIYFIPLPIGIMLVFLSLILTWLSLLKGKLPVVFLFTIPAALFVLAGLLHWKAQNINNSGNGTTVGLAAAIVDAAAFVISIYGITIIFASVLTLVARSVDRHCAERGSYDHE